MKMFQTHIKKYFLTFQVAAYPTNGDLDEGRAHLVEFISTWQRSNLRIFMVTKKNFF
jgi:hypothetical protein